MGVWYDDWGHLAVTMEGTIRRIRENGVFAVMTEINPKVGSEIHVWAPDKPKVVRIAIVRAVVDLSVINRGDYHRILKTLSYWSGYWDEDEWLEKTRVTHPFLNPKYILLLEVVGEKSEAEVRSTSGT